MINLETENEIISIIDYGAGNIQSVRNAFIVIGYDTQVITTPEQLSKARIAVLPGVGSFGAAAANLRKTNLDQAILEYIGDNKPFLGICLGMQLLFESSEESPQEKGLGVFLGEVKKIPQVGEFKVPHTGWDRLDVRWLKGIYRDMREQPYAYFNHSFYVDSGNKELASATTQYSALMDVSVECENLAAVQYHPEKSGMTGLRILNSFARRSIECLQRG